MGLDGLGYPFQLKWFYCGTAAWLPWVPLTWWRGEPPPCRTAPCWWAHMALAAGEPALGAWPGCRSGFPSGFSPCSSRRSAGPGPTAPCRLCSCAPAAAEREQGMCSPLSSLSSCWDSGAALGWAPASPTFFCMQSSAMESQHWEDNSAASSARGRRSSKEALGIFCTSEVR